jgi:hypothetical protein
MVDEKEYYWAFLKYCPECGGLLEQNAVMPKYSCFLHGDFELEKDVIIWNRTKHLINRG